MKTLAQKLDDLQRALESLPEGNARTQTLADLNDIRTAIAELAISNFMQKMEHDLALAGGKK